METNINLKIIFLWTDYKNKEEDDTITLEVDGSYTMDNIKEIIYDKTGTAPEQLKLFYEGNEVRDTDMMYDLEHFWPEDGQKVDIVMCCEVLWLLPAERSRSRSRSPRRSDLENENCIF